MTVSKTIFSIIPVVQCELKSISEVVGTVLIWIPMITCLTWLGPLVESMEGAVLPVIPFIFPCSFTRSSTTLALSPSTQLELHHGSSQTVIPPGTVCTETLYLDGAVNTTALLSCKRRESIYRINERQIVHKDGQLTAWFFAQTTAQHQRL